MCLVNYEQESRVSAMLTVAVVKEVSDGSRRAPAPRL